MAYGLRHLALNIWASGRPSRQRLVPIPGSNRTNTVPDVSLVCSKMSRPG